MSCLKNRLGLLLVLGLVAAPLVCNAGAAPKKSGVNIYLLGSGLLLLSSGSTFAYFQNREADRDMRVYRRSGFTDNTVVYREKVRDHEKFTWLGLGAAALGGILVVVSF